MIMEKTARGKKDIVLGYILSLGTPGMLKTGECCGNAMCQCVLKPIWLLFGWLTDCTLTGMMYGKTCSHYYRAQIIDGDSIRIWIQTSVCSHNWRSSLKVPRVSFFSTEMIMANGKLTVIALIEFLYSLSGSVSALNPHTDLKYGSCTAEFTLGP